MLTFWKEEYRLGVDEVDDQHILICDIMGRFQQALDEHADACVVENIFDKLNNTLIEHFRHEEHYLSSIGYPKVDLQEHVDGHLDVLFTFDHEFSNWKNSLECEPYEGRLLNLCTWAIGELLASDLKIKTFLEMRKPGCSPAERP